MKKLLVIFFAVMYSYITFASNQFTSYASNYISVVGVYRTSAYDGIYSLYDEIGFPRKACVIDVSLESLPDGYHYDWSISNGFGDEDLFVFPSTKQAYIGQNGNAKYLDLSISVVDESTGCFVATRTVRLVFQEGLIKPIYPPIN